MTGAALVTTKKYYNFAGMMVAVDDSTDLIYFTNDHLSSASLVMSDTGTLLSEHRYKQFGEVRTISGMTNITETDFGYTEQRDCKHWFNGLPSKVLLADFGKILAAEFDYSQNGKSTELE